MNTTKICKKISPLFYLCSIFLIASIFLTACGIDDLPGDYRAHVKLKECISEAERQELRTLGVQALEELDIVFLLSIDKEETFTLSIDKEALKNEFQTTMKDTITSIFKQKWKEIGIHEEQFNSLAMQNGYDSFDAFVDAYIEELRALVDKSLVDGTSFSGAWSAQKTDLTFGELPAVWEKDDSISMSFELNGGTIDLSFTKEQA